LLLVEGFVTEGWGARPATIITLRMLDQMLSLANKRKSPAKKGNAINRQKMPSDLLRCYAKKSYRKKVDKN